MANYSNESPYAITPENQLSLDFFVPRPVTAQDDDVQFVIEDRKSVV